MARPRWIDVLRKCGLELADEGPARRHQLDQFLPLWPTAQRGAEKQALEFLGAVEKKAA
jgi:hypothetical protein